MQGIEFNKERGKHSESVYNKNNISIKQQQKDNEKNRQTHKQRDKQQTVRQTHKEIEKKKSPLR